MHLSVPVKGYSDLVIVHLRQQVTALTRVFLGDGWQMSVTRVVNVQKKKIALRSRVVTRCLLSQVTPFERFKIRCTNIQNGSDRDDWNWYRRSNFRVRNTMIETHHLKDAREHREENTFEILCRQEGMKRDRRLRKQNLHTVKIKEKTWHAFILEKRESWQKKEEERDFLQ